MIKKFFIPVIIAFVVSMLINFPTSYAAQIRFADVGVETLTTQLKQMLSSNETRKYLESLGYPEISITDITREKRFDIPSKGLSAWYCYFTMEESRQGQVIFLSDSNGYVFEVCVACYKSKLSASAGAAIMWCLNILSMALTESEASILEKEWSAWSANKNRRFTISRETDDNGIYMIYKAYDR